MYSNMKYYENICNCTRYKQEVEICQLLAADLLNVMAIRDKRHAYASKQTTLLDDVDVGSPKWRACGLGINRSGLHEH